jgi:mRNA-degrading endonuclease RelE of RelBE toxin-antitoxin system
MYKVLPARSFERDAKVLLKKYASLRNELAELGKQLALNPTQGTPIGHNCYKIRQAVKSKGKGKSGGARIITYVVTDNETIILLTIYDKSEKENLLPGELEELLSGI